MAVVHFIHPGDLATSTGGYRYARSLLAALQRRGVTIAVHRLADSFPFPDRVALAEAAGVLAGIADGSPVIVDGLALGAMPREAAANAHRLKLIALVHHPLAMETGLQPAEAARLQASEQAALACVRAVVVPSEATAQNLRDSYGVPATAITVALPGTDRSLTGPGAGPVAQARASVPGEVRPVHLLCVASITPRKGHLDLVQALAACRSRNPRLAWRLSCVGSLEHDPACAAALRAGIAALGLTGQVDLLGERDETGVARAYEAADVFVLASYHEGYGMVLAEALAHGLPVVSTTAGAIPQTVPPQAGLLVAPGDVGALAEALERVLADPGLRNTLAAAASRAAAGLPDWDVAAGIFMQVVSSLQERDAGRSAEGDALAFSASWLALREPFDHAARAEVLTQALRRFLESTASGGHLRVLDLACGSGSTLRYLAPRLGGRQHWTMVDRDPSLLGVLARSGDAGAGSTGTGPGNPDVSFDALQFDLAGDLSRLPLEGVGLVTASALLDLVSAAWLERLVALLAAPSAAGVAARRRPALLLALSYDGSMDWLPRLEDDDWVTALFNRHQSSDKGFGPALGATAAAATAAQLQAAGYRVMRASSPWRVGSGAMQRELLTGVAAGAAAMSGDASARVLEWLKCRMALIDAGSARVEVGHEDLLALPGDSGRD